MTVILECTKTGRFWFCDNKQQAEAFGRAMFERCGKDWPAMMDVACGAAIRAQGDAMGGVK